MGLFDKLKEKSRGILTAAKPQEGVAPVSEHEVRSRLLAISGTGIETAEEGTEVVASWGAQVASAGAGGGEYEYLYRAIRVELDASKNEAAGVCFKTTTNAELGADRFSASKSWERGQHIGVEKLHVIAWLGPHHTSGGADKEGYTFGWSQLRDPVIEAVTGAGWTYKPKKV
ncbi:MAG: hypothetical protein ACRDKT_01240 [Actinomycetota bacterium]